MSEDFWLHSDRKNLTDTVRDAMDVIAKLWDPDKGPLVRLDIRIVPPHTHRSGRKIAAQAFAYVKTPDGVEHGVGVEGASEYEMSAVVSWTIAALIAEYGQ